MTSTEIIQLHTEAVLQPVSSTTAATTNGSNLSDQRQAVPPFAVHAARYVAASLTGTVEKLDDDEASVRDMVTLTLRAFGITRDVVPETLRCISEETRATAQCPLDELHDGQQRHLLFPTPLRCSPTLVLLDPELMYPPLLTTPIVYASLHNLCRAFVTTDSRLPEQEGRRVIERYQEEMRRLFTWFGVQLVETSQRSGFFAAITVEEDAEPLAKEEEATVAPRRRRLQCPPKVPDDGHVTRYIAPVSRLLTEFATRYINLLELMALKTSGVRLTGRPEDEDDEDDDDVPTSVAITTQEEKEEEQTEDDITGDDDKEEKREEEDGEEEEETEFIRDAIYRTRWPDVCVPQAAYDAYIAPVDPRVRPLLSYQDGSKERAIPADALWSAMDKSISGTSDNALLSQQVIFTNLAWRITTEMFGLALTQTDLATLLLGATPEHTIKTSTELLQIIFKQPHSAYSRIRRRCLFAVLYCAFASKFENPVAATPPPIDTSDPPPFIISSETAPSY